QRAPRQTPGYDFRLVGIAGGTSRGKAIGLISAAYSPPQNVPMSSTQKLLLITAAQETSPETMPKADPHYRAKRRLRRPVLSRSLPLARRTRYPFFGIKSDRAGMAYGGRPRLVDRSRANLA